MNEDADRLVKELEDEFDMRGTPATSAQKRKDKNKNEESSKKREIVFLSGE